jgi:protein-serine/threonine kinase
LPPSKNNKNTPYQPQAVSNNCKNLIRRLLDKQESKRLGSKAGASEVKQHPLFKSLKFALLRHMTPPIVPGVTASNANIYRPHHHKESGSLDLENDEPIMINPCSDITSTIHSQDPFAKFNSGMIFTLCSEAMCANSSTIIIVTLYHDGDSDSETIVLTDDEDDEKF